MKVGIFGCGFSGTQIGTTMKTSEAQVWGTTRDPNKANGLSMRGIEPLIFDGNALQDSVVSALSTVTHLVISIAPPRNEAEDLTLRPVDPVLVALNNHHANSSNLDGHDPLAFLVPNLKWIGYLSTVGVYGNHDGAWIDETAALEPSSARSRQRVRAEQDWINLAGGAGLPLSIFRLSGIYGPGRNALVSAHEGRSRRLVKPGQVFNRIHVKDIAQAVHRAAEKSAAGIFNITDDLPAPPQDVVSFAHQVLGTEPPPELDFDTAELSPMARSFYGDNKRVSNQRSKDQLNMDYQWPNYRVALQRMYDEECWKG